jgi:hypothetical protein
MSRLSIPNPSLLVRTVLTPARTGKTPSAQAGVEEPCWSQRGYPARFYGLDSPPPIDRLAAMAEPWRPFRTWTIGLIRLAGDPGTVLGRR